MIRPIYYTILSFLIFCGCNQRSDPKVYDGYVQEIIIANIKHTIGIGNTAKMAYRFPPPEDVNNGRYKIYYDSIKQMLGTASVFIAFTDSSAHTLPGDTTDIQSASADIKDPDGYQLAKDIFSDIITKNELDIKNISAGILLPVKIDNSRTRSHDERLIAKFSYSKIVFNEKRTKAVVYQNYYCGGKCGFGELRLLERVNEVWVVIESIRTWIS